MVIAALRRQYRARLLFWIDDSWQLVAGGWTTAYIGLVLQSEVPEGTLRVPGMVSRNSVNNSVIVAEPWAMELSCFRDLRFRRRPCLVWQFNGTPH
jgi:hypothetical protein